MSAFHGEYELDIDLRIGICHPQKMPLLTELENLFWRVSTKMSLLRSYETFFVRFHKDAALMGLKNRNVNLGRRTC